MKILRLVFVVCAIVGILQAQSKPMFTVTDLGILPGKTISQATALSSNGMVVGYSATPDFSAFQGWIYSNGIQTPLALSGPSIPLGVNASGQIVGVAGSLPSPFFYLNGNENTPDAVGDGTYPTVSLPQAIGDAGAVAITFAPDLFFYGQDGPFMQAGVWANGTLTYLPLPGPCLALEVPVNIDAPNFCVAATLGISENGQYVAGFIWYPNQLLQYHPAIWSNGQLQVIGSTSNAVIAAVNNSGQGAGLVSGEAAIVSAAAPTTSLGGQWFPAGINNNGWVVGSDQGYPLRNDVGFLFAQPLHTTISPGSANAIVWLGNAMYKLNTCSCIANSSGWEFDYAVAVNDAGQIAGTGFYNGVQTAFLLTPQSPPAITAVVNGASFAKGGVAPGEIVTAFGTNLTSSTGINLTSGVPLPTTFLTDSLTVNNKPVALFAVDNSNGQQQINFQVPWEVASGPNATIAVSNGGTAGASISVPVVTAQPGIFNYSAGGNTFGAILHANFALANSANPATPGETVLIYCTGLGAVSSEPEDGAAGNGQPTLATPTVTIGGTKAIVSFSGLAPGFVGLYQINAQVPPTLIAGNQPVVITMSETSSNSVLLPVAQ
jgi:uncharacterized protein (TIGR03437 family)